MLNTRTYLKNLVLYFERDIKHQIDLLNQNTPIKYMNNTGYHNKNLMNIRDKLITCYQKAGLSLTQVNTTILSFLLGKKKYIENVHRLS